MNTDVSHLGGCAGACGCKSCGFTMDTPYRKDSLAQLPYTRMFGHVMGVKGLAQLQPSDKSGPVMTRATNLANLTAAFLLRFEPSGRDEILVRIGGLNWSNDVLKLAKNTPGVLSITDAVRFSLGLHFLIGLVEAERGVDSQNARAYLAFARIFKDAQDRRAGRLNGVSGASGLGGLGDMVSDHKWCDANAGKLYPVSQMDACKRCPTPMWAPIKRLNAFNYQEIFGKWECAPGTDPAQTVAPNDGRQKRGLPVNWVPPVAFPPPADIASVDLAKIQVANCGSNPIDWARGNAGDLGFKSEKVAGVRIVFKRVFGRDANNAEAQYYGSTRYCVNKDGTGAATLEPLMRDVRQAIVAKRYNTTTPTPADDGVVKPSMFAERSWLGDTQASADQTGRAIETAAQAALEFVGKTTEFIKDVICKGLKQVLGDAVGGVVCEIISFILNAVQALNNMPLTLLQNAVTTIIRFANLLIQGKPLDAVMELLKYVSRVCFLVTAPISVPILLAGTGKTVAAGTKELLELSDEVTKKNPLFPVVLIMAIVQLIMAPTPNSIINITVALTPMIAVLIGPKMMGLLQLARDKAIEGVERFIKFVLIVIQGFMAVKDLIPKLRGQLTALFKKRFGSGANLEKIAKSVVGVLDAFQAGFNGFQKAVEQFKFAQVAEAATTFLNMVPDILIALVGDEISAEMSVTLTEWRMSVDRAVKEADQREAVLQQGARDVLLSIPFVSAMVPMIDRTMEEKDLKQRASMVAQIVGKTRLENRSGFEATFIPAFRTELLKVN